MSEQLAFSNSLKLLAGTVRSGAFDKALTAHTLERLSEVAGLMEVELLALRTLKHQRDLHRQIEEQAMRALHNIGAIPETAPFQPIKTAQDLKADNVTPFRPRGPEKT
jgi:hypothetical protein